MANAACLPHEHHSRDTNVLSSVSNEDNTQIPNENLSIKIKRGRFQRQHALSFPSIAESALEDVRKQIENKIELQERIKANCTIPNDLNITNSENKCNDMDDSINGSETFRKEYQNHEHEVYARHIQEGDSNIMLICEPKTSTSKVYFKQVGNKNIMVNLHISTSTCQLMDWKNHCILKLHTDGEVWLEIKRASSVFGHEPNCTRRQDQWNNLNKEDDSGSNCCNNLNDDTLSEMKNINISCNSCNTDGCYNSYPRQTHSSEHEDKTFSSEFDGETIRLNEDERRLSLKFKKQSTQHLKFLNCENIHDSLIMQHQKVVDFLMNAGNNFDVSIYDWEYDQQSVYECSYIMKVAHDDRGSDGYDVPNNWIALTHPSERRHEPEENESDGSSCTEFSNSAITTECDVHAYDTVREINRHNNRTPPVPPRTRANAVLSYDYKWYHGNINQDQARARLKGKPPGSFLVRDSFQKREGQEFTIEFVDQDNTIKKLSIIKTDDKFHFKAFTDKRFGQVDQLVKTILQSGLEIKDSSGLGWKILKMYPVNM